MPYLVITGADGRSSKFEMERGRRVTIGRSSHNEIVLRDPALSRCHAELGVKDGVWTVADCGSRNGTFLDNKPVSAAVELRHGSRITVGRCTLDFSIEPDSAEQVVISDEPVGSRPAVVLRPSEENTLPGGEASGGPQAADWQARLRRFRIIEQANLELLGHEPVEVLLPKVLNLVFEAVKPERAALLLEEPDAGLVCKAYRGDADQGEMQISRTIARKVMRDQLSVLTSDAQADPRFRSGDSVVSLGVRAVMAVPLRRDTDVIGLIYVDSRLSTALFQEEDLRVLTMLANIAAIQIENARLLEEHRRQIRFEQEMLAAAALQRRLLPRRSPHIPGYKIEAVNIPCYEVGGDYYDYAQLGDRRFGIVLADVAGKGLPAAMLMMGLQATFRAVASLSPEPDRLLGDLNGAMARSAPRARYVTMCYLDLDADEHSIRWINAGHGPAPVLVRATGETEMLHSTAVPLGVLEQTDFPIGRVELGEGDFVLMCSDGVTETVGPDDEEFGCERLERLLSSLAGKNPREVRRTVEDQLQQHAQGTRQPDDLAILVLQRCAGD